MKQRKRKQIDEFLKSALFQTEGNVLSFNITKYIVYVHNLYLCYSCLKNKMKKKTLKLILYMKRKNNSHIFQIQWGSHESFK